jgi:hypothetical protein
MLGESGARQNRVAAERSTKPADEMNVRYWRKADIGLIGDE